MNIDVPSDCGCTYAAATYLGYQQFLDSSFQFFMVKPYFHRGPLWRPMYESFCKKHF